MRQHLTVPAALVTASLSMAVTSAHAVGLVWRQAMMGRPKALAILGSILFLGATAAHAAPVTPYVVTIEQDGANVVATGSGEFNLTGLSFVEEVGSGVNGEISPADSAVDFSTIGDTADLYIATMSGPANFGSGTFTDASSNNGGPYVAFELNGAPPEFTLIVPHLYTSETPLAISQDIFDNTTLAILGIIPGTYTWTWGTAADQSFTIVAGTPIPAALPLFATGFGVMGLFGWRRKRKTQAAI